MAAVIGWGGALAPLGLLRLPVSALACFAVGGLLYAPYPALSATLFQRESPPELLSQVLATNASAEAYLLRGCARYTEAMLTRGKLDAATEDFRAALELNPALRLDRSAFSPKLVAFFDQLRGSS